MRTLKTLEPGKPDTRSLLARYGASLLYVRYRSDEDNGERLKTVELVIQRRCPAREAFPAPGMLGVRDAGAASRKVALRIGLRKRSLQRRVKSARGRMGPGPAGLGGAARPGRSWIYCTGSSAVVPRSGTRAYI